MNQDIQKMNQDFYACHLFEFLRKENPLVSFCTMHFTGGFKKVKPMSSKTFKVRKVAIAGGGAVQVPEQENLRCGCVLMC